MIDQADAPLLLADPANFLHSMDINGDRAIFFRTNAQLLRDAAFVDGQIPIATTKTEDASLSDVIKANSPVPATDRFLFMCSFCGSTYLSRMLNVPGRSLVLKEPRVLTDIAAWKIFSRREGRSIDPLVPSLRLARAALRRRFAPEEKVTVKLTSQANILLETLARDSHRIRPVFITISRLNFLRAIFRGGAERMHYATWIAWFMATDEPDGDALLKEAVRAGSDPLRKAANLAVLARHFQVRAFRRAAQIGGWTDKHVIDFDLITSAPHEAAAKAVAALNLDITEAQIERNLAEMSGQHAKQLERKFSIERQQSADRTSLAGHRQVFDDALSWAETTLGPQLNVTDDIASSSA